MRRRILIIDNYDSYTFNLRQNFTAIRDTEVVVIRNRQFEWLRFKAEILPCFHAIVISPGPGRPTEMDDFGLCSQVLAEADIPILGVCLGHQGLATVYGGSVIRANPPMHGRLSKVHHNETGIFKFVPNPFHAVRYHSLIVSSEDLPSSLEVNGWTENEADNISILMGLRHKTKPIWSVQFHPESICTEFGQAMISNFCDLVDNFWIEKEHTPVQFQSTIDVIPKPLISENSPTTKLMTVLIEELDFYLDSETIFAKIFSGKDYCFWLDSAKLEKGLRRFSFMGGGELGPEGMFLSYRINDRTLNLLQNGQSSKRTLHSKESFFHFIAEIMHNSRTNPNDVEYINDKSPRSCLPFLGGLVGYLGYEMNAESMSYGKDDNQMRRKAAENVSPDASFIFADRLIGLDHLNEKMYIISLVNRVGPENRRIQQNWMRNIKSQFIDLQGVQLPSVNVDPNLDYNPNMKLFHSESHYKDNIQRSMEKINQGETYEVCLTTQMVGTLKERHPHPFEFYRHLRKRNPAPYAAYLSLGAGLVIASSSPERFVRIESDNVITMKPIKGTLKVANPQNFDGDENACVQENLRRRSQLANNEKDRSENLMIVDLIRNDLNQISENNSVKVPKLMEVESYSTVHQLVSTVEGKVRSELGAVDTLMACFPPGSMTGAPKLRTVKILEELEGIPRGIYSGCIGYFSVNKRCDFSVVIRTAVFETNQECTKVRVGAGGAIVMLSDIDAEFDEMTLKAQSVLPIKQRRNVLGTIWMFVLIMTPLWLSQVLVYRQPIPHEELRQLNSFSFDIGIYIYIHNSNGFRLAHFVQDRVNSKIQQKSNLVKYSIIAADEAVGDQKKRRDGHYTMGIACAKNDEVLILADRSVEIKVSKCNELEMISVASEVLNAIFVNEFNALSNRFKSIGNIEGEELRVMKYSGEYELVYSLVVANPNDFVVSWEVHEAIQQFVVPLATQFENITSFKISSTIQNYASLTHIPPKDANGFILYPNDLTMYLNSAEWNLGSVVSLAPAVNFVIYIPEKSVTPLQILHYDNTPAKSNAFMILQWGGVKIHNLKDSSGDRIKLKVKDLHPIMEVFGEQLRVLLGIVPIDGDQFNSTLAEYSVTVHNDGKVGVTRWEMDRLLRTRIMDNVFDAISTLHSLESLLNNLPAIPVYDHITKVVERSFKSFKMARSLIQDGNYQQASLEAKNAIVSAEDAFFDPTMVGYMYFPMEHILAIYTPYFVPLIVPLISTVVREIKRTRAARAAKVKSD